MAWIVLISLLIDITKQRSYTAVQLANGIPNQRVYFYEMEFVLAVYTQS